VLSLTPDPGDATVVMIGTLVIGGWAVNVWYTEQGTGVPASL